MTKEGRDAEAALGWNPVRDLPDGFRELIAATRAALDEAREPDLRVRRAGPAAALVATWEQVLQQPAFASAPPNFRADALNRSAIALQWSAEILDAPDGLEIAIARFEEAGRLVAADDWGRPGYRIPDKCDQGDDLGPRFDPDR